MKKFLLIIFTLLFSMTQVFACSFNKINSVIKKGPVKKTSTISISVKNASNGKILYKKNDKILSHPASSLKLFTFMSSVDALGENYKFETKIYRDNKNNLYIKLGADPLLKYADLKQLVRGANINKVNKIYIDDSIIDKIEYPSGWLTDDFWPSLPKLSPYTLDKNTVEVKLNIVDNGIIKAFQHNDYQLSLINEVQKGTKEELSVSKNYGEESEIINLKGTISKDTSIFIPVNNPKFYFIANLENILKKEKINYTDQFYFSKVPNGTKEISVVSHSLSEVGKEILQNSDNFASEILFKVAGGKYKNSDLGSTKAGIEMFYNYCTKLGLDVENIKITDASGVSRYNLVSSDWMSNALIKIKDTNIKNYMATPDIGTLKQRLRHLDGSIWAKTGTLSGISSIEGYMLTKDKKDVVFVIIIQNFNKKKSIIKSFEDDLVNAIYLL
ncbi:MAG: D-alanyl-D-alanine carboxypeptidase/D-alanyl-D-alanine-endopeptidase [Cyanobacteria bacterium SIG30]|nr:D-alanyl-D-alanine carboxypeptidase/D-alanyl-D-alanine-endopeptidase [Cyanobacteria bacterium SIG30]